jgi:hypothetical protein
LEPKLAIIAITGIRHHNTARNIFFHGLTNLLHSDLCFGLELHWLWNPGCFPALAVLGPDLGQVQTVRNREAG